MSTKSAKSIDDSYSCMGVDTNLYYQARCASCGGVVAGVEFQQRKIHGVNVVHIKIPPRSCAKCARKANDAEHQSALADPGRCGRK
jgi:hypothetical protein